MERGTALGSGTQGNNTASGLFGCMLELLVHAIQLRLCFTSEPAETQLLVNYICTTLRHTCSHLWRAFLQQFSRIGMNEILIRDIIPEGGQLKKKKKIKTKQCRPLGCAHSCFLCLLYNCSNDYSWRDRISCIIPFFGNSGPKYILGCTLKTKGVNVFNEFHMQWMSYMDDI